MSNIVPAQFGQVSTVFQGQQVVDDLSAGVQAGYGLIGYRGKVWSIKYRGEERQLMRDDGDGPRNSIEVVILKASTHIAKIWYEKGYVEGSSEAPDCYSNNGVVPEANSRKMQSQACAVCPRNVWGSRITPAGKQGKECSDSKRLAVVPLIDIDNEMFGGPLLLRVPAASLQDLAQYGQAMQKLGYPYYAIDTRIAFDANEAFPKFVFSGIRPLTDQEAMKVVAHRDSASIDRIMADIASAAPVQVAQQTALAQAFEQPPAQAPVQGAGTFQQPQMQPQQSQPGTGGGFTQPVQPAAMTGAHAPQTSGVGSAPAMQASQAPSPQTQTGQFVGGVNGASTQNGTSSQQPTNQGAQQLATQPQPQQTQQAQPQVMSSGFGPMTGGGFTQSAQAAAPTTQGRTIEHDPGQGSATQSAGTNSSGFTTQQNQGGGATPAAQQMTQDSPRFEGQPSAGDVPAFLGGSSGTQQGNQSDFEASLDAKLAALLPHA